MSGATAMKISCWRLRRSSGGRPGFPDIIDGRLKSCATPLQQVLPGCTDDEIRSLGRSLRRTFFSTLIDHTVTPEEMRGELLSVIRGGPASVRKSYRPEPQLVQARRSHAGTP
jgi:hypothetical protein